MKSVKKSISWITARVILAFAVITAWIPAASAGTCPENRWVPVPKLNYIVPAYPEQYTTYWVFDFRTYPNMKLEIKGRFPHARYMSLILYDFNGGEIAKYNNQAQVLIDRDIQADDENTNPYMPEVYRDAKKRDYTVYVVHEDNEDSDRILADGTPMPNTLVIPSGLEVASIFLRVYVPDNPTSAQGDVSLPEISVINLNTGLPSPCPPEQLRLPDRLTQGNDASPPNITEQDIQEGMPYDDKVHPFEDIFAFNPGDGWGLYPNGNNPYLIAPLFKWQDKVATMKFKAPTFPKTMTGPPDTMFSEGDEVRYFSVCMGGIIMSNTSACLADEDLKIDEDRMVRIAVVPNGTAQYFENDPLWNVFQWGLHEAPLLLYRQIGANPAFENSFLAVDPAFSADSEENANLTEQDILDKRATLNIGEYAPRGVYCELDDFINNRCGQ